MCSSGKDNSRTLSQCPASASISSPINRSYKGLGVPHQEVAGY